MCTGSDDDLFESRSDRLHAFDQFIKAKRCRIRDFHEWNSAAEDKVEAVVGAASFDGFEVNIFFNNHQKRRVAVRARTNVARCSITVSLKETVTGDALRGLVAKRLNQLCHILERARLLAQQKIHKPLCLARTDARELLEIRCELFYAVHGVKKLKRL